MEQSRSSLLQLNRCKRQRFPESGQRKRRRKEIVRIFSLNPFSQKEMAPISRGKSNSPFLRRLRLLLLHDRLRGVFAKSIQNFHDLLIEKSPSPPGERNRFSFFFDGDVDVPEIFRDKGLNSFVLFDDKAEGGELART